jgi:hypothetical protein
MYTKDQVEAALCAESVRKDDIIAIIRDIPEKGVTEEHLRAAMEAFESTISKETIDKVIARLKQQPPARCPSPPPGLSRGQSASCVACNAPLPSGAHYCTACGHDQWACGKCNTPLPQGARFCPSCGAQRCLSCLRPVDPSASYCPACGAPQQGGRAAAASAVAQTPVCGNCQTALGAGAKFCQACGQLV